MKRANGWPVVFCLVRGIGRAQRHLSVTPRLGIVQCHSEKRLSVVLKVSERVCHALWEKWGNVERVCECVWLHLLGS